MNLSEPRRPRAENIVPMINVAFLLLIFFLMTAVIAPSDPVPIDPPKAAGTADEPEDATLFVEADGTIWKGNQPSANFEDLAGRTVSLRVARDLSGSVLAQLLQDLKTAGVEDVILVVARP